MTDPKKTPTRRIQRVRPEEQTVARIDQPRPKRSRAPMREDIVVVDKNDPRRERD